MAVLLALVATSCGGSDDPSAPSVDSSPSNAVGQGTGSEASSAAGSTVSVPEEAEPSNTVDGPPAPDFELALADGSSFSSSAAEKPIYMVFWAEW